MIASPLFEIIYGDFISLQIIIRVNAAIAETISIVLEFMSASMPTKVKSDEDYARMGDPVLLDKIDRLFECNLGDLVDLPQLVVVGDQSSGKSSVLAGLTKLPFPRDSGLCTRFATQIIFRRSNVESIKVSIIPGGNSTAEHAENVKAWKTEVDKLDADSFRRILSEVR